MPKPKLNPDEMLKTEFEYAANSAFQANEDRSKAASFFLVAVGSLVAAILGVENLELAPSSFIALSGLFVVLTFLGLLTIMQLARLRAAWTQAAEAMNKIKDFYIQHFDNVEFTNAFLWRSGTVPPKYKPYSVSYFTVVEVSLLSGLTFGAAVYLFFVGLAGDLDPIKCIWPLTGAASALVFFSGVLIYKRMLQ